MDPEPNREAELIQAALNLNDPERVIFLNGACLGDPGLRQRLEALLAARDQSDAMPATQAEAERPTVKLEFADAPLDEAVGQTLGRYKLLERVGEGGCGVVYVAEQTAPVRRRVAIKVIKLGMDTKQVVARFEAERQALAMMDHANAVLLERAGRTNEALDVLSKMVANAEAQAPSVTNFQWTAALELRSALLRRLNRRSEAQADLLRAKAIPERDPQAKASLIDLSPYYNAGLTEDFHAPARSSARGLGGLASLPPGLDKLGGVEFDVRGIVQLAGRELQQVRAGYPSKLDGIDLRRKVQRLHFLHSAAWGAPDGVEIGHFLVHYAGGETRTIPIVCGKDVREWRFFPAQTALEDRPEPVWTGAVRGEASARLFKTSWDNPLPGLEVTSLDYVSAMTASAPFLLAITTE